MGGERGGGRGRVGGERGEGRGERGEGRGERGEGRGRNVPGMNKRNLLVLRTCIPHAHMHSRRCCPLYTRRIYLC